MLYSTLNLQASIQRQFVDRLKESGYAVKFQVDGSVEVPNILLFPTPKGTVTLVPEFPADPLNMARSPVLNDGTVAKPGQVMVPAFAVSIPDSSKKMRRVGIGQSEFERWLTVYIYGFTYDKSDQRELKDLLYEWLEIGDVRLQVWDYDTSSSSPAELEAMDVIDANVSKEDRVTEVDAIRYYVIATLIVSYFE